MEPLARLFFRKADWGIHTGSLREGFPFGFPVAVFEVRPLRNHRLLLLSFFPVRAEE